MSFRILISSLLLLLAQPLAAFDATAIANDVVEDWTGWMKKHGIKAGSIIVSHNGTVVAESGMARSVDEPAKVASLSKSITAICALTAAKEAGKGAQTQLFDAIPVALEGHPPKDDRFPNITIGQLITHKSGLDTDYHRVELAKLRTFEKENKLWQFSKVAKETLSGQPGFAAYRYSNANYLVLGLVIEELTGEGYEEYCLREVLNPAGVTTAKLNPKWRVMSSWGGWEISARDFLSFAEHNFAGDYGPERPAGFVLFPASTERGRNYGAGVLFRRTGDGTNTWHSGSWIGVKGRVTDRFGPILHCMTMGSRS